MSVEELSPIEFSERWPSDNRDDVQLLDVREPLELATVSLPDTVHIPMLQVPARLGELDSSRAVVVMCHTGQRSRHVAAYLATNGFEEVYNLTGGIDAWAVQLEPDLPRY